MEVAVRAMAPAVLEQLAVAARAVEEKVAAGRVEAVRVAGAAGAVQVGE